MAMTPDEEKRHTISEIIAGMDDPGFQAFVRRELRKAPMDEPTRYAAIPVVTTTVRAFRVAIIIALVTGFVAGLVIGLFA